MVSTYVIAVAGPSGAGKSTLIQNLVARLGDANELSLDDYRASSFYPEAEQWIAAGADPNEFKMPYFDEDVRALKAGKSVRHPRTRVELKPLPFLVLEEHFGRGRTAICDLIDFVVYLDTPLEVSYIRKLARKTDFLPWEEDPPVFIKHLRENMDWYQRVGRGFYLAVSEKARSTSDLVVDGLLPGEAIADRVMEALHEKN